MTIKTELGYIEITNEVMAGIAGFAASSCFGVKGMTIRSMSDGWRTCSDAKTSRAASR